MDVNKVSSYEVMKKLSNDFGKKTIQVTREGMESYLTGMYIVAGFSFAFPTVIRKGPDCIKKYSENFHTVKEDSSWHEITSTLGVGSGFISEICLSYSIIENDMSNLLFTPLITNGISLAYELGKKVYSNYQKKRNELEEKKGLENLI